MFIWRMQSLSFNISLLTTLLCTCFLEDIGLVLIKIPLIVCILTESKYCNCVPKFELAFFPRILSHNSLLSAPFTHVTFLSPFIVSLGSRQLITILFPPNPPLYQSILYIYVNILFILIPLFFYSFF